MSLPPSSPFLLRHWFLPACLLGYLWFTLINHLRVEWTVNPQYRYGWAVPALCLYLIWRRRRRSEQGAGSKERGAGSGERGGENGNVEHRTSNIEHRASDIEQPTDE